MQPTRFERVMFATLVPALALPIVVATLALWVQPGPDDPNSDLGHLITGPMMGVFMTVLLGSMTLNAWLLIRRPVNLQSRSIPRRPGLVLVFLYVTTAVWILMLFLTHLNSSVFNVLALAVIVESIFVFAQILRTQRATSMTFTEAGLAPTVKWGLLAYLGIAVGLIIATIALLVEPPRGDWLPYWIPVAIALGLPWSPGALLVVVLAMATNFILGIQLRPEEPTVPVEIVLLLLPAIINITLAVGILASPKTRALALGVLFFRGTERASAD